MYWLRATAVVLVAFGASYLLLSTALAFAWRAAGNRLSRWGADSLFMLRVLPLVLAYATVALLAIPSYLSYEPAGAHERMEWTAQAIAVLGAAIVLFGLYNAGRAWLQAARFVRTAVPNDKAVLLVTGFWRAKFVVSEAAKKTLDLPQLHAAMRHEVAHVRHRDNLKQLVLRFCAFPGLAQLDRAWLRAAEVAADDAATADADSAVELASALVAVARVVGDSPKLAMSLVPETDAPLAERVERLLRWQSGAKRQFDWRHCAAAVFACAVVFALQAGWFVAQAHEATELLFTR
jgi:Zn-dependent protease with chaperone function